MAGEMKTEMLTYPIKKSNDHRYDTFSSKKQVQFYV